MGINPYPAAEFPVNAYSTDIKEQFKEDEQREVVIAGRMMGRRVMGKASFAEIQDSKGRIQVYILVTTFVQVKTKTYTTKYSRNCLTLVTSSVSKALYSRHRWVRFPFMQRRSHYSQRV